MVSKRAASRASVSFFDIRALSIVIVAVWAGLLDENCRVWQFQHYHETKMLVEKKILSKIFLELLFAGILLSFHLS